MRCAAATYDILSQLGVVKRYPLKSIYWKIFYPKLLRLRLYAKAKENGWAVIKQEGSAKRNGNRIKQNIKITALNQHLFFNFMK